MLELINTTSCGTGELLVKLIVTLPALAVRLFLVYMSIPVGFAAMLITPAVLDGLAPVVVVFVLLGGVFADPGSAPVAPSR